MTEPLPQIVEETIKLELNMANLYEMFSSVFPEDSDFWNKFVEEEKKHASLIKTGRDVLLTCDEFPTEILSPSLKELVDVNKRILAIKKEYWEKTRSRKSAFEFASSLEQSAGEIQYNMAIDQPSQNEYIRIFQNLSKDCKDHYKRLQDYMSSHSLTL